ncbi:hypothetical protein NDU88_010317 [Pleurodeles waltl]|uniref:Uncharacterized protein n=1 Tax=Pleurodeles waltl TaxID=8319 RepID=A0AAV7PXY8_PLEWA|nr:hypothetical protein NDU88_010317 [Pleurodeles waltl]
MPAVHPKLDIKRFLHPTRIVLVFSTTSFLLTCGGPVFDLRVARVQPNQRGRTSRSCRRASPQRAGSIESRLFKAEGTAGASATFLSSPRWLQQGQGRFPTYACFEGPQKHQAGADLNETLLASHLHE